MLFILNILAWSTLLLRSTTTSLEALFPITALNHVRLAPALEVLTVLPNLQSPADILFIVLNIKLMIRLLIVWLIINADMIETGSSYPMLVVVWSVCECFRYLS